VGACSRMRQNSTASKGWDSPSRLWVKGPPAAPERAPEAGLCALIDPSTLGVVGSSSSEGIFLGRL
jgi:hypothetical protein